MILICTSKRVILSSFPLDRPYFPKSKISVGWWWRVQPKRSEIARMNAVLRYMVLITWWMKKVDYGWSKWTPIQAYRQIQRCYRKWFQECWMMHSRWCWIQYLSLKEMRTRCFHCRGTTVRRTSGKYWRLRYDRN